nr:hypothetical protein Iba_chr07aCG12050 [Ipomoea batatas]
MKDSGAGFVGVAHYVLAKTIGSQAAPVVLVTSPSARLYVSSTLIAALLQGDHISEESFGEAIHFERRDLHHPARKDFAGVIKANSHVLKLRGTVNMHYCWPLHCLVLVGIIVDWRRETKAVENMEDVKGSLEALVLSLRYSQSLLYKGRRGHQKGPDSRSTTCLYVLTSLYLLCEGHRCHLPCISEQTPPQSLHLSATSPPTHHLYQGP